jgi:hypothetical protein
MTANDQSTFWDSIPTALRQAIELAVPAQILQDKLPLPEHPSTLASKYTQLETLLRDTVEQEHQPIPPSNNQYIHHQPPETPHTSALFPLAMLQTEIHHYTAAESTWLTLLSANHPSQPNLAAMSNLIDVLNLQHKYAEAEALAMKLLPLLQNTLGENSPQALGCMRKSMLSLVGQDKGDGAKEVLLKGLELVATIGDSDVKMDEEDAMQDMATRIASVV